MDPFTVLGVPTNCTIDVAQKAYRKAAQKYHPDRPGGGNEAKFKSVKEAWELIEKGYRAQPQAEFRKAQWTRPETPGNTWRANEYTTTEDVNTIFEYMKRANRAAPNYPTGGYGQPQPDLQPAVNELVAQASIREAFAGFNMLVPNQQRNGTLTQATVNIPPGTPHGYRGHYTTTDGRNIAITTRIDAGKFTIRGLDDSNNLFSAGLYPGDIELEMELDAIDLITGCWLAVEDFLGEKLSVRVPAGFNPLNRLKVAGKGYYGWLAEYGRSSNARQAMYIRVKPVFNAPANIEKKKIIDLYNSVQGLNADDAPA